MTESNHVHDARLSEAMTEAQAQGRYLRQEQAALTRRVNQLHKGTSDIAGAGYAARRDKVVGATVAGLMLYAIIVGYLIAGLDLPIGWTWLAAAGVVVLVFLISRLIRMCRIRGRLLPR